jgi:zinc transporter ZupT
MPVVEKKDKKKPKPVLNAAAKEKKILSSIRSFVIVLALSIHSIFEGMAIGKDCSLSNGAAAG